jgi:hypothetical protein
MIALLAAACAHEDNAARCTAVKPGQYFAVGTFALEKGEKEFDDLVQSLYGKPLCAMNEQPMTPRAVDEAYRFLWLRTFHHPISVRIETAGGKAILVAVELDGKGGYEPGAVERRKTRTLTAEEWRSLLAAVSAAGFWELPTEDPKAQHGFDGAEWIIEGYRAGTYHVVDRWEGPPPIRAVGEAFLRAAHFSIPANEVY